MGSQHDCAARRAAGVFGDAGTCRLRVGIVGAVLLCVLSSRAVAGSAAAVARRNGYLRIDRVASVHSHGAVDERQRHYLAAHQFLFAVRRSHPRCAGVGERHGEHAIRRHLRFVGLRYRFDWFRVDS